MLTYVLPVWTLLSWALLLAVIVQLRRISGRLRRAEYCLRLLVPECPHLPPSDDAGPPE